MMRPAAQNRSIANVFTSERVLLMLSIVYLAVLFFMLDYLRTRSLDIFVWYRFGLAAFVVIVLFARGG